MGLCDFCQAVMMVMTMCGSHPKPFTCDIRPRSERSTELIARALRADGSA